MGCVSSGAHSPLNATPPADNTLLASPRKLKWKEICTDVDADEINPIVFKNSFDGVWSGGVISNGSLTMTNGNPAPQEVKIDRREGAIELCLGGGNFIYGKLDDDDKIHWSNGSVWTRHHVCTAYYEYEGFMEGPDILAQTMTLEEARSKASSLPDCVGFACSGDYHPEADPDLPVKFHFKSTWNLGHAPGKSFKKEEVPCAVGDAVTALLPPTDRRYDAKIISIAPDGVIAVKWEDSGKTHRNLLPSQVFKDGRCLQLRRVSPCSSASSKVASEHSSHPSHSNNERDAIAGLPRGCGWNRFFKDEPSTETEELLGCVAEKDACEDVSPSAASHDIEVDEIPINDTRLLRAVPAKDFIRPCC